jgi:hypothetical protein
MNRGVIITQDILIIYKSITISICIAVDSIISGL